MPYTYTPLCVTHKIRARNGVRNVHSAGTAARFYTTATTIVKTDLGGHTRRAFWVYSMPSPLSYTRNTVPHPTLSGSLPNGGPLEERTTGKPSNGGGVCVSVCTEGNEYNNNNRRAVFCGWRCNTATTPYAQWWSKYVCSSLWDPLRSVPYAARRTTNVKCQELETMNALPRLLLHRTRARARITYENTAVVKL